MPLPQFRPAAHPAQYMGPRKLMRLVAVACLTGYPCADFWIAVGLLCAFAKADVSERSPSFRPVKVGFVRSSNPKAATLGAGHSLVASVKPRLIFPCGDVNACHNLERPTHGSHAPAICTRS